ncbi:MAG TPA: pyridoxal phosphate-dependent aminotransferase [Terriglobales bacterium]|nr:pyridoxal phosphate-dependent aminotransferase [Terriglobales bacterium]
MFSHRTDWQLAPNRLTAAIEEARALGQPFIDLTISNPTRAGITYDGTSILDSLRHDASLDYDPQPKGLLAAREAVADYYRGRHEEVDPESLILTSGTSEGYSYVFRLLANPGEEILVPKPSYPLFEFLADLQDVRLVPYPLLYDHGWQIDFHSVEKAIGPATRGIVLVNPNNPTGSYVSYAEREQLNDICRQRGLALIVDEVFLDYSLGDVPYPSFATNTGALTFALTGLSKISALPQMKLAWIAVSGPANLAQEARQRLEVIADTYLSVSAPVQLAARTLLEQRLTVQSQILTRVQQNLAELDRQLALQKTCSRLAAEGGWYAILRVPVTQSDEDLAIALLREKGVLVHPGHFYDFPQDGFLVLSLIAGPAEFCSGIEKVLNFLGN